MNLDSAGQTAVFVAFFGTLATAVIPPTFRFLWSKRRDNSVFTVSADQTAKTCVRHKKQCSSAESVVLQMFSFFIGGLLFAYLVIRLVPQSYHQFELVVERLNSTLAESRIASKLNKNMPYVELAISGFFFAVYFVEQLIQALTGWDGWHGKSSFVHLPTIDTSGKPADRRKSDEMPLDNIDDNNQPSLVSCHQKSFEEEIVADNSGEEGTANEIRHHQHRPNCPLARNQLAAQDSASAVGGANDKRGKNKQLRLPSRPSRPSSIIIVLPSGSNEEPTQLLQLRLGFGIIASVSVHQITNGVTVAVQEGSWCWIAFFILQSHSLLTAILVTAKLAKHCTDPYIVFLCQLVFSSITPLAIIIASLLKGSAICELILIGLSSGAAFHLVFMTLLQRERCTRLAGLVQYLSMYSGFTVTLCITLFMIG